MALTIVKSDEAETGEKLLAGGYIVVEGVAHGALVIGITGLACSAAAPCLKAAEALLGIGTSACADGDCTNEIQVLNQAIQNAAGLLKNSISQGYNSFNAFKNAQGSAGPGMAWHHIIEQTPSNLSRFGAQAIHNIGNLIRLPSGAGLLHQRISGYYSSIQPLVTGSNTLTIRQWLQTKSLEFQWNFGIQVIMEFGGGEYIIDQFGNYLK